MLRLMQLEMRKTRVWRSALVVIMIQVLLALQMLVAFLTAPVLEFPISQPDLLFVVMLSISKLVVMIYGAVLLNWVVLREYTEGTIGQLFLYPSGRRAVLSAKLLLIGVTVGVTMILGMALAGYAVLALDAVITFLPSRVSPSQISKYAVQMLFHVVTTVLMSFIPLVVGLLRKSQGALLLSAIVLALVVNSNNDGYSLATEPRVQTALALCGLLVIGYTLGWVAQQDVTD